MKVKIANLELNLPHPAAFALQKLIISQRRPKEEKRLRDRQVAFHILHCLIEQGEGDKIRNLFKSFPKKWKTSVLNALEDSEEKNILALFS